MLDGLKSNHFQVASNLPFNHKYQSQKIQLYENFNFVFQPGSVTVITGGNGTGKTTLFRLLAGIIEPENGSVLIDGINLKQISKIWWRTQLTAVPQEPNFWMEQF